MILMCQLKEEGKEAYGKEKGMGGAGREEKEGAEEKPAGLKTARETQERGQARPPARGLKVCGPGSY